MSRKSQPSQRKPDTRPLRLLAALLLALLVPTFISCAGGRKSPVTTNAPDVARPSTTDVLNEIDALETPEGVDNALFTDLREAFKAELLTYGIKSTTTPPSGPNSRVDDLMVENDGGRPRFSWHYCNLGDYDQNGAVGISDITPIAMHYGEDVPEDGGIPDDYSIQAVVDGSGNDTVDIADITPIAMNYGVNCAGYKIKNAPGGGGPWSDHADIPLENASGEGRLEFTETVDVGAGEYYRVVPVDADGEEGEPSNIMQFGTTPPTILSVNPTTVVIGTMVQFSASISGSAPISYWWTFDEACSPYLSTQASPLVTVPSERGEYPCSLAAHNPFGDDTHDFMLTVTGVPPVIEDVQYTPGGETELITFTATVTGDEPMTYYWEFGGGLDGDSSTETEPALTATAQGNYDGTLTVTNEAGEDSQPFNYTINPPPEAPEILDIGPTGGEIGAEITISANVSGSTPLTYAWDFDEASSTGSSDQASPTITLTSTPGVYPCSLEVNNAYGTDIKPFEISVYSSFEGVMLVVDGGGPQDPPDHVGSYCRLVVAGGHPAIAYYNSTNSSLEFIRATNPYGTEWNEVSNVVVDDHDAGTWMDAKIVDGNPAVAYHNADDKDLMFVRAMNAEGSGAWYSPIMLDDVSDKTTGRHCTLSVLESSPACPAVSYYQDSGGQLKFVRAMNADGSSWGIPRLIQEDSCGVFNSLIVVQGRPAISYRAYSDEELRFVRADDEFGDYWLDEPVVAQNLHDPWYTQLAVLDGKPAIVYQDDGISPENGRLMFIRAEDALGDAWSDPIVLDDGGVSDADTGQYASLKVINGLPAVAYHAGSPDGALMYIIAKDAWGGAWEDPVMVDSGSGNYVGQYASMREVSGHPAIAYYDLGDYVLKYVIADDAYGHEWPEEP